MKTCTKCHEEKPLTIEYYNKEITGKDGWRTRCKRCDNERKKKWRSKKGSSYASWDGMNQRCHNEKNSNYHRYGARGIKVCDRWRDSLENFLEDVGERPSIKYSIDRIDNYKGYYKENCKWSTREEQAQNRRVMSTNKSGHTGVCWNKQNNNWRVQIISNNKKYELGSYKNIEDAIEARRQGVLKYHNKHS